MGKRKPSSKEDKNYELIIKPYPGRVIKLKINSLRRKYIKYPKLRKFLDKLEVFINWSNAFSMGVAVVYIVILMLILYCVLPDNIKETLTPIIGGFMSLIIVPLLLDIINKKMEIKKEQYDQSSEFYEGLNKAVIDVLRTNDKEYIIALIKLIDDNYAYICYKLPRKLCDSIMALYEECALSLSKDERVNTKETLIYS